MNKMTSLHYSLVSILILLLSACNAVQERQTNGQTENIEVIGGAVDDHGCLSAAGESWSQLYERCLQIFNEGVRLNPTKVQEGEACIRAFVLYSPDSTQLELFLPQGEVQAILPQTQPKVYELGEYVYNAQEGKLYIKGVIAYQIENTTP